MSHRVEHPLVAVDGKDDFAIGFATNVLPIMAQVLAENPHESTLIEYGFFKYLSGVLNGALLGIGKPYSNAALKELIDELKSAAEGVQTWVDSPMHDVYLGARLKVRDPRYVVQIAPPPPSTPFPRVTSYSKAPSVVRAPSVVPAPSAVPAPLAVPAPVVAIEAICQKIRSQVQPHPNRELGDALAKFASAIIRRDRQAQGEACWPLGRMLERLPRFANETVAAMHGMDAWQSGGITEAIEALFNLTRRGLSQPVQESLDIPPVEICIKWLQERHRKVVRLLQKKRAFSEQKAVELSEIMDLLKTSRTRAQQAISKINADVTKNLDIHDRFLAEPGKVGKVYSLFAWTLKEMSREEPQKAGTKRKSYRKARAL